MSINAKYPSLKGFSALVTGGVSGLGRVLSDTLLDNGMTLFVADVDTENGLAAEVEYKSKGFDYRFIKTDLSNNSSVDDLIKTIGREAHSLKVLVNNARPKLERRSLPESLEKFDFEMQIMLKTPILLMTAFEKLRMKNEAASIINISSTNSMLISDQGLSYHVAKAALNQATRYFSNYYSGNLIRVNTISPGIIDFVHSENKNLTNEFDSLTRSAVPLSRGAKPIEIANAVTFLASDDSSYITGENILVDGGFSIGDRFSALAHFIRK